MVEQDQLQDSQSAKSCGGCIGSTKKVAVLFGTRPELIKLAPVIYELNRFSHVLHTITVSSAQQNDLLSQMVRDFEIRASHDLHAMEDHQTPASLFGRILPRMELILQKEKPDLLLVQGDTTTAIAGALAGFYMRVPVAHVEAGLRSGDDYNPYPEEMNRKLITRLATYHFAATKGNCKNLLAEGVPPENIILTGNPIVDSVLRFSGISSGGSFLTDLLHSTEGCRRIVLTTHRRESFGESMAGILEVLYEFVIRHESIVLLFPVHPNPEVISCVRRTLPHHLRIHLLPPLAYAEFIQLLGHSWLIVSDSGGIQEEAPSLGKPLIIIRNVTERPEVVDSGIARLAGEHPRGLAHLLEEAYQPDSWAEHASVVDNPFGAGDAGRRIVQAILGFLRLSSAEEHEGDPLRDQGSLDRLRAREVPQYSEIPQR